MLKTIEETILENTGIKIKPEEEKILRRLDLEGVGPGYTVDRRGIVTVVSYQPTEEEKPCAELLVKSGLITPRKNYPHLYTMTEKGKVQMFDIIMIRLHYRRLKGIYP